MIGARVEKAIDYMMDRLGETIIYKRGPHKTWAPTGWTVTWDEESTTTAIVYNAETNDIDASGGRLQLNDKAFVILKSSLSSAPAPGDIIEYGADEYEIVSDGGASVIQEDITHKTYTVWGRLKKDE